MIRDVSLLQRQCRRESEGERYVRRAYAIASDSQFGIIDSECSHRLRRSIDETESSVRLRHHLELHHSSRNELDSPSSMFSIGRFQTTTADWLPTMLKENTPLIHKVTRSTEEENSFDVLSFSSVNSVPCRSTGTPTPNLAQVFRVPKRSFVENLVEDKFFVSLFRKI